MEPKQRVVSALIDATHVSFPTFAFFGAVTIVDVRELLQVVLAVVTIVCTLIVTRHKLKEKK